MSAPRFPPVLEDAFAKALGQLPPFVSRDAIEAALRPLLEALLDEAALRAGEASRAAAGQPATGVRPLRAGCFLTPPADLRVGALAKVRFIAAHQRGDRPSEGAEAVWVRVEDVDGDLYRGVLEVVPLTLPLDYGSPVAFSLEHVIDVARAIAQR